jgi:hypothetical protein
MCSDTPSKNLRECSRGKHFLYESICIIDLRKSHCFFTVITDYNIRNVESLPGTATGSVDSISSGFSARVPSSLTSAFNVSVAMTVYIRKVVVLTVDSILGRNIDWCRACH